MDHVRAELQYAKTRTQHTILPFVRRWRRPRRAAWFTQYVLCSKVRAFWRDKVDLSYRIEHHIDNRNVSIEEGYPLDAYRWRQDKWYTREKQEEMTRDKG